MSFFRTLSIKSQLVLLILLVSGVVLLLACATFVIYDQFVFRQTMLGHLETLADVTGINTAAIVDLDRSAEAERTLASLKTASQVVAACIYRKDGSILARYPPERSAAGGADFPKLEADDTHRFQGMFLSVFRPILWQDEKVGTIYLRSTMSEMHARLRRFSGTVGIIMIAAFGVVFLLSSRLQKLISDPILDLAETARTVSESQNYVQRATRRSGGEVGFLVDQFNGMLEQIEKREKALDNVNKQLADSEKRALSATQAKSQFLASMSHELRTPLTAIIGFSEMLLAQAETEGRKEEAEDLFRINDSANYLLGLINGILDLSKIEARKMELHIESFEVLPLVRDLAGTIRPLVNKKSNTLIIECPEDIGSMTADAIKVRQSLLNLLSNANKFTDKGEVRLTVVRETRPNGQCMIFRVTDTGVGMTPEQRGKLFEAFTQGDSATTRKFGGTGLGLAITKHFSEMMGGSVRVQSEPGQGSTFEMQIPVEVEKPKTARSEPATIVTPATGANHKRVLVIDDDPNVHRLIEMTLKGEGCALSFASSGREGLRLAKELKPAVITLDVIMPEPDGWSVLTALKADAELAAIPVIMLTILENKDLGFALGASEYLMKPIDRTRLAEALKRYWREKPSGHVLVVEDDTALRGLLRRMLESDDWQVTEAENGRAALESIRDKTPSVVLLDLIMPVMDGFQVLAEMQRHPEWRKIPVVIITAKDLNEEDRKVLLNYTEKILMKGSHVREDLVREVRRCVERYRGEYSV